MVSGYREDLGPKVKEFYDGLPDGKKTLVRTANLSALGELEQELQNYHLSLANPYVATLLGEVSQEMPTALVKTEDIGERIEQMREPIRQNLYMVQETLPVMKGALGIDEPINATFRNSPYLRIGAGKNKDYIRLYFRFKKKWRKEELKLEGAFQYKGYSSFDKTFTAYKNLYLERTKKNDLEKIELMSCVLNFYFNNPLEIIKNALAEGLTRDDEAREEASKKLAALTAGLGRPRI